MMSTTAGDDASGAVCARAFLSRPHLRGFTRGVAPAARADDCGNGKSSNQREGGGNNRPFPIEPNAECTGDLADHRAGHARKIWINRHVGPSPHSRPGIWGRAPSRGTILGKLMLKGKNLCS